ncbi:STAS domain-containing protein [Streptomyces sp. HNM0575]|uniref:anti-sigma factor antagonist n=1 Tax=Streptomyces sp. HNM0575 TaxID=2716338 RepID=UPI00145EBB60|nr:STAS domain-containing protein [Streptomyces sp. HNM0575]
MTTGDDATGEPQAQGRHDEQAEVTAEDGRPVVSRRNEQGVEVVVLAGELDFETVQDIAPVLDEALAASPGRLVVDLSRVSFADSSALNLLLRTHSRTRLYLCGPLQPFVERLFDVTGLSGVLSLHPGLDEAVRAAAARD